MEGVQQDHYGNMMIRSDGFLCAFCLLSHLSSLFFFLFCLLVLFVSTSSVREQVR